MTTTRYAALCRFIRYAAVCVAIIGAVAGCSTLPGEGSALLKTELYFGMNRPDGDTVTSTAWQAFVDTCITARFPDGFTVVDGYGQWRGTDGAITRERAKILVLIHDRAAETEDALQYIRTCYRQAFRQESVLRVTVPVRASF